MKLRLRYFVGPVVLVWLVFSVNFDWSWGGPALFLLFVLYGLLWGACAAVWANHIVRLSLFAALALPPLAVQCYYSFIDRYHTDRPLHTNFALATMFFLASLVPADSIYAFITSRMKP